jgi:hypothetical protein
VCRACIHRMLRSQHATDPGAAGLASRHCPLSRLSERRRLGRGPCHGSKAECGGWGRPIFTFPCTSAYSLRMSTSSFGDRARRCHVLPSTPARVSRGSLPVPRWPIGESFWALAPGRLPGPESEGQRWLCWSRRGRALRAAAAWCSGQRLTEAGACARSCRIPAGRRHSRVCDSAS